MLFGYHFGLIWGALDRLLGTVWDVDFGIDSGRGLGEATGNCDWGGKRKQMKNIMVV